MNDLSDSIIEQWKGLLVSTINIIFLSCFQNIVCLKISDALGLHNKDKIH